MSRAGGWPAICCCWRLQDGDPEVRLAAARALVQSGTIEELGQVFRLAISQSLLIRILLAEDLRRHATELCERVVPEVLAGDKPGKPWRPCRFWWRGSARCLLRDLHKLLESPNRESPPGSSAPGEAGSAVHGESFRHAAASAGGRRRGKHRRRPDCRPAAAAGGVARAGALPAHGHGRNWPRIAASALAEMPPKGWQTLQQIAGGSDTSALIAAAALDRGRRKAGV